MLKKHPFCLAALALLCSSASFANVPIESRGLSQGTSTVALNVGAATTTTNLNWQMMEKIQQLENDLRALRGKIDEQENTIELLKKESENRYNDLDARLEALQEKIDPPEAEDTPAEDNQQDTAPSSALKTEAKPSIHVEPKPTAVVQNTPTEEEKTAYTLALDAYKVGGAKKAVQPMKNFIQNYPQSVYISNAHFWLAEFLLAVEPTDFNAVKQHFTTVVNKYPNSAKASNALYRLYTIASNVDQNPQLAKQYKNLLISNYPNAAETKFVQ